MVVAAERRGEADRDRLGVALEFRDEVLAVLDRRIGVHGEHHVVVEERGNGREVAVVDLAPAHDVIGEQRRGADQQRVRIAGALAHVGERDAAAAARPVDHRDRRIDELVVHERALDRAGGLVVAAAGSGADHDLDVPLRAPAALRPAGEACGEQCGTEQTMRDFHGFSSLLSLDTTGTVILSGGGQPHQPSVQPRTAASAMLAPCAARIWRDTSSAVTRPSGRDAPAGLARRVLGLSYPLC